MPPQGVGLWGGTNLENQCPPIEIRMGGTTFGRYLAHNLLRNGRFEAEKGATVWRAYGATAPSLLAPKSLVLTCSIFPRRVPPHPFSHQRFADFQPEVVLPHRWGGHCPPKGPDYGGPIAPPASEIWGGNK